MRKSDWLIISLGFFPLAVFGIDESKVPEKRHTPYGLYLTAEEAYEMKKAAIDGVLLIDVRTRPEVKYIGIANLVDANIPARFIRADFSWSDKSSTYRTRINTNFVADIEKLLKIKAKNKDTPILVMCQSGSRSTPAIKLMHEAGFTEVYNLYQGFEGRKAESGPDKGKRVIDGWIISGLPWGYKLRKESMYFNFDSTRAINTD